jgi:hypothetical protein
MDGHERNDALTDSSLDREIASMLAVEPSPEFLARVRARVAEEPEPNTWRWSWVVATAGAVAVAIVTVIVWPSPESVPASDAAVPSPRVAEAVETIAPPPSSIAPSPRRAQPPTASARRLAAAPDRGIDIDLPEVVIAENEVKTFASLVASIRQSRFAAAVPEVPNPDTPLEIKELPSVELLEIEPIVRVAALQPEGERP